MIKFKVKKEMILSDYLLNEGLNYNKIKALFRKKDIKVNNERIKEDKFVKINDEITLFIDKNFFNIKTIYEDENIIIVDKPKKLEVISATKDISLLNLINPSFYAVHRIDFNTEGLVVFAKNNNAKAELENAFKNSQIDKNYIVIVKNKPIKNEEIFKDFLEKLDGKVKIYSENKKNTKFIKTGIKLIEHKNNFSLLSVSLYTGRTHQIRAHLAFHNLPVLGDEKYGDFKLNKEHKISAQVLKCYKLKFNFEKNSPLYYLNNKEFITEFENIENIFYNITNI